MDSEDARKKRDCAEVVEQLEDGTVNEKTKKLRKENRGVAAAAEHNEAQANNKNDEGQQEDSDGSHDRDDSGRSNGATEPAASCQPTNLSMSTGEKASDPEATTAEADTAASTASDIAVAAHRHDINNEQVVWDLESALNYLVRMDEGKEEYLDSVTKVAFRVGHAGDAATIASWYRRRQTSPASEKRGAHKYAGGKTAEDSGLNVPGAEEKEEGKENATTNDSEDNITGSFSVTAAVASTAQVSAAVAVASEQEAASSLELWLANGLGDEGVPPSAYTLLAHTKCVGRDEDGSKASRLGAIALLTLSWEDAARVLRVEWMRVDPELDVAEVLERRMRLRLAALSLMTACDLHIMSPDVFRN